MAEWLIASVLKTEVPVTVPWVRIPLSPPLHTSVAVYKKSKLLLVTVILGHMFSSVLDCSVSPF